MSHTVKGDCLQLSEVMFCKSGILIFIFAENNYLIYAHTLLINTPLLHQSLGPRVFLSFYSFCLSLSLSLYFWLIPWSTEARWAHFLAWASKTLCRRRTVPSPTWEGPWCLRAAARALRTGLCWLSAWTRGYRPLSLSHCLIVGSGPPGSGPLKDQQGGWQEHHWVSKSKCLCRKRHPASRWNGNNVCLTNDVNVTVGPQTQRCLPITPPLQCRGYLSSMSVPRL